MSCLQASGCPGQVALLQLRLLGLVHQACGTIDPVLRTAVDDAGLKFGVVDRYRSTLPMWPVAR